MFNFGEEVKRVNDDYFGMLSHEEQIIAMRQGDDDDGERAMFEDLRQREGGVVKTIKRLLEEGHIDEEEAGMLCWAANVSIK
jgi:hypothetical protein